MPYRQGQSDASLPQLFGLEVSAASADVKSPARFEASKRRRHVLEHFNVAVIVTTSCIVGTIHVSLRSNRSINSVRCSFAECVENDAPAVIMIKPHTIGAASE